MVNIHSGVLYDFDKDEFIFDFDNQNDREALSLTDVSIRESTFYENTYLFGYEFTHYASPEIRSKFVEKLKTYSESELTLDFKRFMVRPIDAFGKRLYKIDTIVFPKSKKSELTKFLLMYFNKYAGTQNIYALELIKRLPTDVKFNYPLFEEKAKNDLRYPKWIKKINKMMEKIHSSDYFSLSSVFPTILRQFFLDYLEFENKDEQVLFDNIHDKNILLIDDINTTGSTLTQCLQQIHKVSVPKSVMIFTLLGKEYTNLL